MYLQDEIRFLYVAGMVVIGVIDPVSPGQQKALCRNRVLRVDQHIQV